jgi:prephenate dehydrogenase
MVERTGIIGTGLIGGSLALAFKRQGIGGEILGYDTDPASITAALEQGAIDRGCDSPGELAAAVDLVVIAAPVRTIPLILAEIAPYLKKGTLVMDVGSTKERIVRTAQEELPEGVVFVGAHPMAGSERQGIENASPDLFLNAAFIFTPTPSCDAATYSFLSQSFTALGARVIFMDPLVHDRAVSMVSHLPHILAFSLVNAILEGSREVRGMSEIVSGGFRDMTRIASSDPALWTGILLENRAAVAEAIATFNRYCREMGECLEREDAQALSELIVRAKSGRLEIMPALQTALKELYTLSIPVENRPGIISQITRAMGERGINIEDLEIAHPLEDGRGLISVYVRGEEAAQLARDVLLELDFRPSLERSVTET